MPNSLITGRTRLLAVIGDPIGHSLSPVMHNRALAALGEDTVYVACPVGSQDLEAALAGFAAIDLRGFSVTIPHKQAIMPLLGEILPVAQAVGAVNTVGRSANGEWWGTNTDVAGFVAPLRSARGNWPGTTAVILGGGGAARAVVAGCHELGCDRVIIVGRNLAKLRPLQAWFQPPNPLTIPVELLPWSEMATAIAQADLLVNSTPIGMAPKINESPMSPVDFDPLPVGAIVYDLIYTPRPTQFLQLAAARGFQTIDGLEMLVQQGAAALELWLGRSAPVDVMRDALLESLTSRESA